MFSGFVGVRLLAVDTLVWCLIFRGFMFNFNSNCVLLNLKNGFECCWVCVGYICGSWYCADVYLLGCYFVTLVTFEYCVALLVNVDLGSLFCVGLRALFLLLLVFSCFAYLFCCLVLWLCLLCGSFWLDTSLLFVVFLFIVDCCCVVTTCLLR